MSLLSASRRDDDLTHSLGHVHSTIITVDLVAEYHQFNWQQKNVDILLSSLHD